MSPRAARRAIHGPGTYVLILQSTDHKRLRIGKWGLLDMDPGFYLYVGSAFGPGGVLSRVSRHCRQHKVKRWHVDYLRAHTRLGTAWYALGNERLEHQWASLLDAIETTRAIEGFGSSDCRCFSHLFFVPEAAGLESCRKALPPGIGQFDCRSGAAPPRG